MNEQTEMPKFCVGEEVAVYGLLTNKYDIDKTEVTKSRYFNEGTTGNDVGAKPIAGWRYQTAHQPDMSRWWREASLVKLPKRKCNSFENMMGKLKSVDA